MAQDEYNQPICEFIIYSNYSLIQCFNLTNIILGEISASVSAYGSYESNPTVIATIINSPMVNQSTNKLAQNAESYSIFGSNFDSSLQTLYLNYKIDDSNNTYYFKPSNATETSLVLGLNNLEIGDLFVQVFSYQGYSDTFIQVATIVERNFYVFIFNF